MESSQGDIVDVCKKIAQVAAANAPDGWRELTIVRRMLFRLSEGKMYATLADGSRRSVGGGGAPLAKAFRELRDATFVPGKGAWFTANFKLTSGGTFSIDYDYDGEPEWTTPVVVETYAEDIERFPRDPENIPNWLQAKLDNVRGE